ncbi:MAG: PIN domain-containing protein [Acidimicrobiales bacterium]
MAIGVTLDAGALIAFERSERRAVVLVARARERNEPLSVPAGVVGQVWRDGRRQARLARLLGSGAVKVVVLDDFGARAAGQLCGARGTTDVIDATVALCARQRGRRVATSDPADMRRLDPTLELIAL